MSMKSACARPPSGLARPVDAHTRLLGVMGAPVGHSLSPTMHNAALRAMDWPAVYVAFHVVDPAGAITGMRALGISGLSVTIPHKVAVMEYVDELDPLARQIGAVNTIVRREGRLYGFNTDCFGAIAALKEKSGLTGKRVGLIGAGGAARAVGFGLIAEGARVTVFNRGVERGRMLAKALDTEYHPLDRLARQNSDILINTTSVGMVPHHGSSPVPVQVLTSGMVVMDIVYNPLETQLLKDARTAGAIIVDGLSMFVYQGARQLELWTGQTPPVHIMRQAVLAALTGCGPGKEKQRARHGETDR